MTDLGPKSTAIDDFYGPSAVVVDEVEFVVEAGKVREFARAAGSTADDRVPLTFVAVSAHHRDQAAMVSTLGLDIRRVVIGGSEWEYLTPLRIGDRLRGTRVVTDETHKRGMRLLTLETRFVREDDGEVAVIWRDTVIELAAS